MSFRPFLLALSISTVSFSSQSESREDEAATGTGIQVLTEARIVTMDSARPLAEAIAWDAAGVILAVGTESEVLAAIGDDHELISAKGNLVLPGFVDTHVHVPEAGINESLCLLPPEESIDTYEALIADCAEEQTTDDWVRAAGATLFSLRDTDELPIDVLDRAVPDRPALILDDLGHAVWTNSLGLAAAGIEVDDEDPQGGVLLRDPKSGKLTGLLLENAQQRVRNAAAPADSIIYAGLLVALDTLAENGITTMSDAGGYWGQNHPAAWQRALEENMLSVRAINSLYLYPDLDFDTQIDEFERRFSNDPASLLRFNTAKIYIDGILDLGTAAMLEPYDQPVDPNLPSGFEYFERNTLNQYVAALESLGYRMEFHVIGDQAVRLALESIEALGEQGVSKPERPHRTTHTYLVHTDDLPRFAELGVVADLQVGADSTNVLYHEDLSAIIGDRAFDLLPVSALLKAGAAVSLSSDWDADPLSPFGIIERSLTRESFPVDNVETAIGLVTRDAAYALGVGEFTGSLSVGKLADYVIVDRDILDIDINDIGKASILSTVLEGEEVYRSSQFQ